MVIVRASGSGREPPPARMIAVGKPPGGSVMPYFSGIAVIAFRIGPRSSTFFFPDFFFFLLAGTGPPVAVGLEFAAGAAATVFAVSETVNSAKHCGQVAGSPGPASRVIFAPQSGQRVEVGMTKARSRRRATA
jgi:hypothetical protein